MSDLPAGEARLGVGWVGLVPGRSVLTWVVRSGSETVWVGGWSGGWSIGKERAFSREVGLGSLALSSEHLGVGVAGEVQVGILVRFLERGRVLHGDVGADVRSYEVEELLSEGPLLSVVFQLQPRVVHAVQVPGNLVKCFGVALVEVGASPLVPVVESE